MNRTLAGSRSREAGCSVEPSELQPNLFIIIRHHHHRTNANRMVTYSDTGAGAATPASIAYEYDLNGNVRRNYFQYTALDAQGNPGTGTIPRDYWYMYDAMNRFTLTKGQFTGTRGSGTISAAPDSSGMVLTYYLDGQRATVTTSTNQTWTDPETQDVFPYIRNQTETYSYTTDGYLAEMDISYSRYRPILHPR